jgi:hypothetical protein
VGRDSDLATVTGGPGGRGVTAVCCSGLIFAAMGGLQGLEFATSGRTATGSCQVIIFAVVGHRGRARGHKGLYTCSRLFLFDLRMAKSLAPQILFGLIFTPL